MNKQAFERWLDQGRLSGRSPGSYASYARRVERDLGVALDGIDLSDHAIGVLLDRMAAAGVVPKSVTNCGAALRAYARFRAELGSGGE